jgi:hypothetical protein
MFKKIKNFIPLDSKLALYLQIDFSITDLKKFHIGINYNSPHYWRVYKRSIWIYLYRILIVIYIKK